LTTSVPHLVSLMRTTGKREVVGNARTTGYCSESYTELLLGQISTVLVS
jgi:hypothetical protein